AFQRNSGLRIDHALLSPRVAERLVSFTIDRDERATEKASDHVPVLVTIR
ncbi:exodeoxyribonuclease III, partial [Gluconobacter japonicus]